MLSLRDLHKTLAVTDSNNLRQLENLHQTANDKSKVNALKTLGAEPESYVSLALLGLKQALPQELRKKLSNDCSTEGTLQTQLESMLSFLKEECDALRKAREFRPRKFEKPRDEQPRKKDDKTDRGSFENNTARTKRFFKKNNPDRAKRES